MYIVRGGVGGTVIFIIIPFYYVVRYLVPVLIPVGIIPPKGRG